MQHDESTESVSPVEVYEDQPLLRGHTLHYARPEGYDMTAEAGLTDGQLRRLYSSHFLST